MRVVSIAYADNDCKNEYNIEVQVPASGITTTKSVCMPATKEVNP